MMKYLKISLFFAIFTMLFSSCEKECEHDFAALDTYYDTIHPDEWVETRGTHKPYLYAVRNFPEITDYVVDSGVVLCYLIENKRDNFLPYLRPWGFNDYNEPYFQNIRFDLERRTLTFIIEASDLDFPSKPKLPMEFKVVVMQNFTH